MNIISKIRNAPLGIILFVIILGISLIASGIQALNDLNKSEPSPPPNIVATPTTPVETTEPETEPTESPVEPEPSDQQDFSDLKDKGPNYGDKTSLVGQTLFTDEQLASARQFARDSRAAICKFDANESKEDYIARVSQYWSIDAATKAYNLTFPLNALTDCKLSSTYPTVIVDNKYLEVYIVSEDYYITRESMDNGGTEARVSLTQSLYLLEWVNNGWEHAND